MCLCSIKQKCVQKGYNIRSQSNFALGLRAIFGPCTATKRYQYVLNIALKLSNIYV